MNMSQRSYLMLFTEESKHNSEESLALRNSLFHLTGDGRGSKQFIRGSKDVSDGPQTPLNPGPRHCGV